jgi:hypothetical protein
MADRSMVGILRESIRLLRLVVQFLRMLDRRCKFGSQNFDFRRSLRCFVLRMTSTKVQCQRILWSNLLFSMKNGLVNLPTK